MNVHISYLFFTRLVNTSILCLSFKNRNFKFITLTRAASQPVAKFYRAAFYRAGVVQVATVLQHSSLGSGERRGQLLEVLPCGTRESRTLMS